ncbi:MAG: hypothetical protein WC329_02005 [Candidatus Omnitrophota bacterium]|jgi:hypothetical protein
MGIFRKFDLVIGTWIARTFNLPIPCGVGGGPMNVQTSLEARHFEAIDPGLGAEFLKAHPCTTHPQYWREVVKNRRLVKNKCITTAYVTFLALMHQTDATTIGDFKYHDSGIGTGDEAVGDTGLGTAWGGARSEGTQVASTNAYTSVATTTYNASKAITEHGLFNASSDGTLMDRTKFAAINVVDTNQIQWTFTVTFTAGG